MMRRVVTWCCCIVICWSAHVGRAKGQVNEKSADKVGAYEMRRDPRLGVLISGSHSYPTLDKMLEDISTQTGLRISVDINLARKAPLGFVLSYDQVPAHEVLEQLGDYLAEEPEWVRSADGYRLFGEPKLPAETAQGTRETLQTEAGGRNGRSSTYLVLATISALAAIGLLLTYIRMRRNTAS